MTVMERRQRWAPSAAARIDWSHPLAVGLLGLGLADRIIHGYVGTPGSGATFGAISGTPLGRGRAGTNAAGTTNVKLCDFPAQTDTSQFTLTFVGAPGAGTDVLIGYRNGGGPGLTFVKIFGTATEYYANGTERYAQNHGLASTVAGVIHLVKRGLVLETWRNGSRVHASSAFSTGELDQNAAVCYWLQGDEAGATMTATRYVMSAMHNRALDGNEFAMLAHDPFCILAED